MPRPERKPEFDPQQDFDFEKDPVPSNIIHSAEFKRAKEKNAEDVLMGKAEKEMYDTVYSQLTAEEKDELRKIENSSERRAYVVRKYSKIFNHPENQ